jgi:hypothetical protein
MPASLSCPPTTAAGTGKTHDHIDIETTRIDPATDAVVEIASVDLLREEFGSLARGRDGSGESP